DLVGAANAMQSAMSIIEEEIKRRGGKKESLGTVVIGTVYGDIHDIGKNMVVAFLLAEGFEVYDLGVNVSAEEFIEAVKRHKADILAMSALMTTTAPEQKKVIEMLKKENLRDKVKVIVGGAAITEEFAQEIEADGYESTAVRAAKLAKKLIGK
ncbi:MAG: cobalamin-dependent protein, partial [Candidatus Bathyarchaeia archaeon]